MSTKKQKPGVLFAAFEAIPFLKTGGLGDVVGSLPRALKKKGFDVRVVLPKLSAIPEKYRQKMTYVTHFFFPLGWRSAYCGIETYTYKGMIYYFIDNEGYFKRDGIYGFFDDGERMAFFSKAVCEIIPHLEDFDCRILHCHDWHTSLAPVFLRECYRGQEVFEKIKTVFTVHNLKFQGQMSDFVLGDVLGLDGVPAAANQLRVDKDTVNYMKGALVYSDIISTVSPSYAQEIQNPFYGEHMERLFQRRWDSLWGILNGIDTTFFNPEKDKAIEANYSKDKMKNKLKCKLALQEEMGFEVNETVPVIIMIGRLTQQKGLDLLTCVIDELLDQTLQLVILGTGDKEYEDMLKGAQVRHPKNLKVLLKFDEKFSHRMYAGGDILLMPSLFEPCGLSQMIAMRYGTLPVVRETGGLRDSVKYYNEYTGEGTGFGFANYNAHEMLFALKDITNLFRTNPKVWRKLMKQAMEEDFSWNHAAGIYKEMYDTLLEEK